MIKIKKSLVIGPFGFGKNHIRQYLKNNFQKIFLLSKNPSNCLNKKKSLTISKKNISKIICLKKKSLKDFSKNSFISICSPNETHHLYLKNKYILKNKILCEKPLIWNKNDDLERQQLISTDLLTKSKGNVIFNDFSKYYSSQIKKIEKFSKIKNILIDYTVKSSTEKNLSVDLLIHLIAITQGFIEISDNLKIIKIIKIKNFHCYDFYIGKTKIKYRLSNKNIKQSILKIKVNKSLYTRKHVNIKNELNVFFQKKSKKFDFKNPLDLGFNFFLNSSTNQRKVNLVKQLKNVKLFFKLLSF